MPSESQLENSWVYNQQLRNRGKSRQNKSRVRHETTIKCQRNPTLDWENSCFESRSNDKCWPFFQVLKKAFHWDAQCEEAFSALKTYLSSFPVLVSPSRGELLTLYLVVSDFSTSAALVKERDRIQQPVYYCSRCNTSKYTLVVFKHN